jgi:hypothetical protein
VSIVVVALALGWLNHQHEALLRSRGERLGEHSALSRILTVTGGIAVAVFAVWFLLFAGTNFAPLQAT